MRQQPCLRQRGRCLVVLLSVLASSLSTPWFVHAQQEQEVDVQRLAERPALLGTLEIAGARISGFVEGTFNWVSALRLPTDALLPDLRLAEVAAPANPGDSNFRFDKFAIGATKRFAPWLLMSAAIEVENERALGAVEAEDGRFVLEIEEGVKVGLDFFEITVIIPIGNGVALSLGKFDVPFGIEREDAPFNLQATTSLVFELGRPTKVTGFRVSYQFAPALDLSLFAVNGWDVDNDNNSGKTVGGRLGLTPWQGVSLGLGGFYGPEQNDRNGPQRGLIDVDLTISSIPRLLLAAEFVYGMEARVRLVVEDETAVRDATWLGVSLTAHYDLTPLVGLTVRYSLFDDQDGRRTGLEQVLHSFTIAPTVHLTSLLPQLGFVSTVPRSRHPVHWVDLRLEYRVDVSNEDAFVGDNTLKNYAHRITVQVVGNF